MRHGSMRQLANSGQSQDSFRLALGLSTRAQGGCPRVTGGLRGLQSGPFSLDTFRHLRHVKSVFTLGRRLYALRGSHLAPVLEGWSRQGALTQGQLST